MRKPRIFIASSVESIDVANAININLDHQAEVTVWKDGFSLSQSSIETLVKSAKIMDFAIFIFTPDDVATIRDKEKYVVRDNVLFELGLFTGTLGKERCYIVKPRDTNLHLPTDLLGLTPADYEGNRTDGNLEAAVNSPSSLIKNEISKLGLISEDMTIQKKVRKKISYDIKLGYVEHSLLLNVLDSHNRSPNGVSAWSTIHDLQKNGINEPVLNLSIIKLERMGYLDKSIYNDCDDEAYYSLTITADGIDYLLENEELVHKVSFNTDLDDEIPF